MELLAVQPQTLGSVAEAMEVHRSTALRLLQTLVEGGFARKLPDGRYSLGYRTLGLAERARDQFNLRSIGHRHLAALTAKTRCTTHLASLEGGTIYYVDKVEPTDSPRMLSSIGARVSLHTAAAAKAILAFQSPEVLDALLDGWDYQPHTSTTLADRAALETELAQVRERGFSVDNREMEDYVNCIAVPVRSATGEVAAAISVTALAVIRNLDSLRDSLPDLKATATAMSRDLGWLPTVDGETASV